MLYNLSNVSIQISKFILMSLQLRRTFQLIADILEINKLCLRGPFHRFFNGIFLNIKIFEKITLCCGWPCMHRDEVFCYKSFT